MTTTAHNRIVVKLDETIRVQYFNTLSQDEIITRTVTAGQLKRLANNRNNSEFYVESNDNWVRIETVDFLAYCGKTVARITI